VRHELRYRGQSFELAVEEELDPSGARSALDPAALRAAFEEEHERRYGYRDADAEIELVNVRVSVWGPRPELAPPAPGAAAVASLSRPLWLGGRELQAEVVRGEPSPGVRLQGPALWELPESTLLVRPGWEGAVDEQGTICLRRAERGV
jgi:N-methylhydantoinase A